MASSDYTAHDLNEFVAWIMVPDADKDVRRVTIADPTLTMGDLAPFFNEQYIVVGPNLTPKTSRTQPWVLALRHKTEADELAGTCTCETPYCLIPVGQKHVRIAQ